MQRIAYRMRFKPSYRTPPCMHLSACRAPHPFLEQRQTSSIGEEDAYAKKRSYCAERHHGNQSFMSITLQNDEVEP